MAIFFPTDRKKLSSFKVSEYIVNRRARVKRYKRGTQSFRERMLFPSVSAEPIFPTIRPAECPISNGETQL